MENKLSYPQKTVCQFEVSMGEEEVAVLYQSALERLSPTVSVAGFRPGKAPTKVVKEKIGTDHLKKEVIGLAVRQIWEKMSNNTEKPPISDPILESFDIEEGKPAKFVFTYDIKPDVKVKGFEKIRIKSLSAEEVTDKEIEDVIENLAYSKAKQIVSGKKIGDGDRVIVNFEGSLNHVRLDKLSGKHFTVNMGRSGLVPGFEDEIKGMKKGDKKSFEITFPKDFFDDDLRGRKVSFAVEVIEVYRLEKPEKNDDLAKSYGAENLTKLKETIKKEMTDEREAEVNNQARLNYFDELEKIIETELPKSLVHKEYHRLEDEFVRFLTSRNLNRADWIKRRQTSEEKMRKSWQEMAEKSVKVGLGIGEIANQLGKELKSNQDYQELVKELIEKARSKK